MRIRIVETCFGQKFALPTHGRLIRKGGKIWIQVADLEITDGIMEWPVWSIDGVRV